MEYRRIIAQIAKKHNVSEKEVDLQLKEALKNAGINIPPDDFLQITAEQIKKTIYNN